MFPEKQDWVDRAFAAVFRMTHPKTMKKAIEMYKNMIAKERSMLILKNQL